MLLQNALDRNLSEAEVDGLSEEELNALYMNGDAQITIDLPFKDDEAREEQFKRDFLKLILQYDAADKEYDEQISRIKEEIGYDQEEFKEIVAQFGEYQGYIREQLVRNIETAADELLKIRAEKLLASFDNGLNQENIIKSLGKSKKGNILKDYYSEQFQLSVYTRFKTVLKRLGLTTDLIRFSGVENKLDTPYNKYQNLFVFAVMRTVAYEKYSTEEQKFYLATLMTVLQEYLADTMDGERKEQFETGVKAVIDHIIAE